MIIRPGAFRPFQVFNYVSRSRTAMPLRAKLPGEIRHKTIPASMLTDKTNDVVFNNVLGVRTLELNRPEKLNALNASMAQKILDRLQEYEQSQLANVIIIKGAGDKSFCSGGDIASLAKANKTGPKGSKTSLEYFGLEYKLDHLIANYTKPYVAFMDGITMGGGVGLSVHGHFRIATEKTVFAMPETAIGFFPDVGASFFLSRLDGMIGRYLALTGHQLKGVQAYYAGVATHYIHSSALPALEARLSELTFDDRLSLEERLAIVDSTIREFESSLPYDEPHIISGERREMIDAVFRYNTMDATMMALERIATANSLVKLKSVKIDEKGMVTKGEEKNKADLNNTVEGFEALKIKTDLMKRSPTSLAVTLRLLFYGQDWSIDEAFQREYLLAEKFMDHKKHPDFVEGVEKTFSKERPKPAPEWHPPQLEDITAEVVDSYFAVNAQLAPMKFVRVAEEPYKQKPYPQGLPSESDIQDALSERPDMNPDAYLETMMTLFNNKLGLEQKLRDVYKRKCKLDNNGFVVWVGSKAFTNSK